MNSRASMKNKSFNNELTGEISELQQEVLQIQKIPQTLLMAVTNCKAIYKDVISGLENFVPDETSASAQILYTTSEVAACLFSTLESHLSIPVDGKGPSTINDYPIREQCNMVLKRLNTTISSLVLSDASTPENEDREDSHGSSKIKGTLGQQIASWKKSLEDEVQRITQKYNDMKKVLHATNQHLEVSEEKYHNLEMEFHLLKEDRDALHQRVSSSTKMLELITGQKERVLKDLNTEVRKRKNLAEEIKQFSVAFAGRQKSIKSFHSDFKTILEAMKAHNPNSLSKCHGS